MTTLVPWPTIPRSVAHPFVSIVTPTYNRRLFLPYLMKCIQEQTYPKERMEWVILDDGSDPIEDLLKSVPLTIPIQYLRSEKKLGIGAKRNRLHDAARGEILVCMDDDDYYMPERVAHAVFMLQSRKASLAGSSRNQVFFTDDKSIWETGPYGTNHATFGTMAYTKDYTRTNRCDEAVAYAEEVAFTNKYANPLVQLDPRKVMLVMAHKDNTFDKSKLRATANPFLRKTTLKMTAFIRTKAIRDFYNGLSL